MGVVLNDVIFVVNMEKTNKIQALINLGLSEREARVYYALFQIKQGGALQVAQSAGIKRATTYHVLQSLVAKKLVAISMFRGVKDYRALPVEHLKSYVRNQHKVITKELPALQAQYNTRNKKQRLRVYHDLASIKTLLEKSLRERAPMHILGEAKILSSYLENYWEYFIKRSRQIGVSPQFKPIMGETMLLLWSDKVAYITFGDTPTLFAYKNKKLHDLYERLWKSY